MDKIRKIFTKLLPSGSVRRSVSILAGGTALGQALAVLITPVLTRIYGAEDFGYFQIYFAFTGIAALAVTLRYELAILLPEQEETAANVVCVTLCAVLLMSGLQGFTAWLLHHNHLLPSNAAGLHPYLWIVPLAVCGAGIYQTLNFWALRQKAYERVAGTRLTQVLTQFGMQLAVGLIHSGPLGLLLGDAAGRMTGSLSLARLLWLRSWNTFRSVRWRTIWGAANRYRRFPLVSSWSSLLNAGAYSVPPLLMAGLFGTKMLGWFALGDRVLGAPTTLIGQAVSQVYAVEAASLAASNPRALQGLFFRSIKSLAILGAAPFVVFFLFAPGLFAFAFGESWREAGVYARILAAMHYLAFICWPLTQTLNILEQQHWQLGWDASRLVLTCGSLWIVFHYGGSARIAIGVLAAAMFLGYAAHLLVSEWAIRQRIQEIERRVPAQAATAEPEFATSGKF